MSTVVFIHANEEVNQNVNQQPEPQSQPRVAICQHIKDDGIRCGTPAVNGSPFCFHHHRAHRPAGRVGERTYRAPLPETIESLQLTIDQVTEALGAGRITDRTAGKLLYAVQLASGLLKMKMKKEAVVAPCPPSAGSSDEVANLAPTAEPVTEIPPAMQEVLAPRPLPEGAAADPYHVSDNDPEMPVTIEEARRALLTPEQFVNHFKTIRDLDKLSPRYVKQERRFQLHTRAYNILRANGIIGDSYMDAVASIPD